jgi:hypothetical protein
MSYIDLDGPKFIRSLPAPVRVYGNIILDAAKAKNVNAFLLYALGQRESGWGDFLKQLAGDWGARAWSSMQIDLFPHVTIVGKSPQGLALVKPSDGLGWGRGLMQLDYVDQYEWLSKNNWRDPATNVARGCDVLLSKYAFFAGRDTATVTDGVNVTVNSWFSSSFKVDAGIFPDPRPLLGGVLDAAAVAAYNAAKENVLRMIVSGGIARIDEVTTGKDYSSSVRNNADAQQTVYMNAA